MGEEKPPEQENSLKVALSILRAEAHGTTGIVAVVVIIAIFAWMVSSGLLQN